mgnify:CR=1 FL=1
MVIIADAEQMKRVINNIISNSVKYLDKKKGIINIRIKDVGDFIQVEIEDNGKGIAAKDLPNIFGPVLPHGFLPQFSPGRKRYRFIHRAQDCGGSRGDVYGPPARKESEQRYILF